MLGSCMGGVQLVEIDTIAKGSNFLLVTDELAVRELIGCVLNERVGLFSTLPVVEVNLELAGVLPFLSVDIVFEVN